MSLISIWGPNATGKTTWLRSVMDEFASIQPNLVVVVCDKAQEYYYRAQTDDWLLINNNIARWKGVKEEKLQWPLSDIAQDVRTWIIESSRYFNGMQPYLIQAFLQNQCSGLSMIFPYAQPEVSREFIRQRCLSQNKSMSHYWENLDNCWGEATNRLNSIAKWFEPNGIPCKAFEIDSERRNWNHVTEYVKSLL